MGALGGFGIRFGDPRRSCRIIAGELFHGAVAGSGDLEAVDLNAPVVHVVPQGNDEGVSASVEGDGIKSAGCRVEHIPVQTVVRVVRRLERSHLHKEDLMSHVLSPGQVFLFFSLYHQGDKMCSATMSARFVTSKMVASRAAIVAF